MKKFLVSLMAVTLIAALAAPAYAAEFTPSAEDKAAPEVITTTNAAGEEVAAVLTDEAGNVVGEIAPNELVITSVAELNDAPTAAIADSLGDAADQIREANDLSALVSELRAALAAANPDAALGDLEISDLFDVSWVKDGAVQDIPENVAVTFTVATRLTLDDLFFALHNYQDSDWELLESALAENGNLTITTKSGMSPFAIAVDKGASLPTPAGPSSPQTGEMVNYTYLFGTVAMLAAAAFLCMKGTKQTEN